MLACYTDKGCEAKKPAIYTGMNYQYKDWTITISPLIHWMVLSVTRLLQSVGERQTTIGSLCRMSIQML